MIGFFVWPYIWNWNRGLCWVVAEDMIDVINAENETEELIKKINR